MCIRAEYRIICVSVVGQVQKNDRSVKGFRLLYEILNESTREIYSEEDMSDLFNYIEKNLKLVKKVTI